MMGALISIGNGSATEEDIQFMLSNPNDKNWLASKMRSASPDGLFLKTVNYKGLENFIERGPYSL